MRYNPIIIFIRPHVLPLPNNYDLGIQSQLMGFIPGRAIANPRIRNILGNLSSGIQGINTPPPHGLCVHNGELGLFPIHLEHYYYLIGKNLPFNMVHDSRVIIEEPNENYIYGNTNSTSPMVVKSPNHIPSDYDKAGPRQRLLINTQILLGHRNIYIHPGIYAQSSNMGHARDSIRVPTTNFLIFGGIPGEAISDIQELIQV